MLVLDPAALPVMARLLEQRIQPLIEQMPCRSRQIGLDHPKSFLPLSLFACAQRHTANGQLPFVPTGILSKTSLTRFHDWRWGLMR